MNIKAWLFLIGKNRRFGYTPILVPDILVAANIPGRLDEFNSNQIYDDPICKVVEIKEVGIFTVVYRTVHITDNGKVLTDLQKRPIIWSEGILIKGNYPNITLPPDAFGYFHQQFAQYAMKFYHEEQNNNYFKSQMLEIALTAGQLEETIKQLKEIVSTLKEQEKEILEQIAEIDQKGQTGKTLTIVGIPLVLVIIGLIVIPVGLYMSKTASEERKDPEQVLKKLRGQIETLESEIQKIETDI